MKEDAASRREPRLSCCSGLARWLKNYLRVACRLDAKRSSGALA